MCGGLELVWLYTALPEALTTSCQPWQPKDFPAGRSVQPETVSPRVLGGAGAWLHPETRARRASSHHRVTQTKNTEGESFTLQKGTDPEDESHGEIAQEIHVNFIMVAEQLFLAEFLEK